MLSTMHAEPSIHFAEHGRRSRSGFASSYLPHMMVATAAVMVMPVLVVWGLHSGGVISSPWIGALLAVILSLAASLAGRGYWTRRGGSEDVVFSDLLLWGWLRRAHTERQVRGAVEALDQAGTHAGAEQVESRLRLLTQLAGALDAEDIYLDGHSRRVARHAVATARRMGVSGQRLAAVRTAAAIHDVGKLHLPAEIVGKPGRLSDAEYEITKTHAEEGAKMVACLGNREVTEIVWHHHERFDGSGYPSHLAGEQIPLGARIVAVADAFDAMTSARPYRAALSHEQALDTLQNEAGQQLDPVAVHAFVEYYNGRRVTAVLWGAVAAAPQGATVARAARAASTGVAVGLVSAVVVAVSLTSAASQHPHALARASSSPAQLRAPVASPTVSHPVRTRSDRAVLIAGVRSGGTTGAAGRSGARSSARSHAGGSGTAGRSTTGASQGITRTGGASHRGTGRGPGGGGSTTGPGGGNTIGTIGTPGGGGGTGGTSGAGSSAGAGAGGSATGAGGTVHGNGGTPPGQNISPPPGQSISTPPGHGGSPPGHGGTPPGQSTGGPPGQGTGGPPGQSAGGQGTGNGPTGNGPPGQNVDGHQGGGHGRGNGPTGNGPPGQNGGQH
jgi:HD domain